MRVFVLNTGRCGSVTLARACERLTNYTAGHETRARRVGDDRLDYPDQHIEVDNRLSWFLGALDERYGEEPLYVHLRRDPVQVAQSFAKRWENGNPAGVITAFATSLVIHPAPWPDAQRMEVCRFYVQTVTANIEAFLADKPNQMTVWLDDAATWFPAFWDRIGGQGDYDAALAQFGIQHNAS
ncbi:hypothetical protein LG943_19945 [Streptomonospora sp. S1-112]|uniref:Sulfotransferase family protein n=1 Tax=Streptomonospora mangrovi TaxID=2883123 RepID=A0A9X3SH09_9ACTN|nr:hypothetical protein [Streptomonospora mangrovi]MDA0566565.1 hypothetical protein [Streptomonospora mangrovi]